MLVEFILTDTVKVHGVLHDAGAEFLVLFEKAVYPGEFLGVLDRLFEEL